MILGPVFRAELLRVARRRRGYVARVTFGLILLLILTVSYGAMSRQIRLEGGPELVSTGEMARFGESLFRSFVVAQLACVLAVVPAATAGVIADEKQRKTLHYLMATPLSGPEIVLDKLCSRLVSLGMLVAIGAPLMFSLTLFGGVSPGMILVAYGATASSTFFLASVAVGISAVVRRVREAVLITYLFVVAWLAAPMIVAFEFPGPFPVMDKYLAPINAWILPTDPWLWWNLAQNAGRGGPGPWTRLGQAGETLAWGCGLQVLYGSLVVGLAAARLRPAFRAHAGGPARVSWFKDKGRPRSRLWAKPPVGDDPMGWKESWFTRPDVFMKMIVLPFTAVLTVCLLVGSGIDETFNNAFSELRHAGYRWSTMTARGVFNRDLRWLSLYYAGIWLVAVAGSAASTVGVERDGDTWTSLIASPLTGREILGGKRRGTIWGLRGFGALLGLIWATGLVTGALHPLGLLLAAAVMAAGTWFAASLGVYCSLTSKTTARALGRTIAVMAFLNVGYYVVLMIYWGVDGPPPWGSFGCLPYLEWRAMFSFEDVRWGLSVQGQEVLWSTRFGLLREVIGGVCGVVLYAAGAIALIWAGDARFDRLVDRPRESPKPTRRKARREPAAVVATV